MKINVQKFTKRLEPHVSLPQRNRYPRLRSTRTYDMTKYASSTNTEDGASMQFNSVMQ